MRGSCSTITTRLQILHRVEYQMVRKVGRRLKSVDRCFWEMDIDLELEVVLQSLLQMTLAP